MTRDLVICIDGTWNSTTEGLISASGPTNVVRISKLLTDEGGRQRVLYLPGVGTGSRSDRLIGGIWGSGSAARVLKSSLIGSRALVVYVDVDGPSAANNRP